MVRRALPVYPALILGFFFQFSTAFLLAYEDGAQPGRSGGPAGSSANCTECHAYADGHGRAEILSAPKRYRSSAAYDLVLRIADTDRLGAGFEISAEAGGGFAGQFQLTDPVRTQFAEGQPEYVTHTLVGLEDSIAEWSSHGDRFDFHVRWTAPAVDIGTVTLFLAAQAVNDSGGAEGEHYYAAHARLRFAEPGDADGDEDIDLRDIATQQRCFGLGGASAECQYADTSGDGAVEAEDFGDLAGLLTGPTAIVPGEYLDADVVRGGQLYDRWWEVIAVAAPTGRHPLYPASSLQNGSTTYRCKECHGWDYKGKDGAYGSGSRYTGIAGILNATGSPQDIFALLKENPETIDNGHSMGSYGLSDTDLWDLTKMSLEGTLETSNVIQSGGAFLGNAEFGGAYYTFACTSCHGDLGTQLNFGNANDPEYVGTVAQENPWELLHRIRFGVPETPMAATELLGWSLDAARDIGAYSQTLPR